MRARAGRDVRGVFRSSRCCRCDVLLRVAKAVRPLDVMPTMRDRIRDLSGGRERRLLSLKALGGRLQRWRCWSLGRNVNVLDRSL